MTRSLVMVMLTVLGDTCGIILCGYLQMGKTVNNEYCSELLQQINGEKTPNLMERCAKDAKNCFSPQGQMQLSSSTSVILASTHLVSIPCVPDKSTKNTFDAAEAWLELVKEGQSKTGRLLL